MRECPSVLSPPSPAGTGTACLDPSPDPPTFLEASSSAAPADDDALPLRSARAMIFMCPHLATSYLYRNSTSQNLFFNIGPRISPRTNCGNASSIDANDERINASSTMVDIVVIMPLPCRYSRRRWERDNFSGRKEDGLGRDV